MIDISRSKIAAKLDTVRKDLWSLQRRGVIEMRNVKNRANELASDGTPWGEARASLLRSVGSDVDATQFVPV